MIMFSLSGPQTTSTRERERSCSGVTSVIFRYGVYTKTCYRQCCKSTAMRNNGKCTKCELSPCQKKHGILEVPEETDCSGITSVRISFLSIISVNVTFQITISRSRRRDRQEKRTRIKPLKEKTTLSPGKEKILTIGIGSERLGKEGYALGYASGKFFIAAGYAPGYASGNF
ncbi:hypothetical protein T09_12507 [Trichinella sp. T9]|nr:hypothetical protein T09_12507 [Trichinella sp. T9]